MAKIMTLIVSSLALIILLVLVVQWIADTMFDQKVNKEVLEFLNNSRNNPNRVIEKADLEELPTPVEKWLINAQVVGKEKISIARLKQKGMMRTAMDKPWMNFQAEQYFTTENPGFIWKAKVNAAPMMHLVARDKYAQGKGNMLIKALSFITVGNSSGKEMDQGTLLRYLAEMPWLPTAALSPYIQWEEIDDNTAKATMSYEGVSASAIFVFNNQGDIHSFSAQRYGLFDGKYSMETWAGVSGEIKEMDGLRIPTQGEVTWKLKTGDFTWLKWEITEVEYNKPELYGH